MQPLRSRSSPAVLDTTLEPSAKTLNKLASVIKETPGKALTPTLPCFHAEVVGKHRKIEANQQAIKSMEGPISAVPLFQKFGTVPEKFAKKFSTLDGPIKKLAIDVIFGNDEVANEVLEVIKKRIDLGLKGKGKVVIEIVDWFLDELEEGRLHAKDENPELLTNPVTQYLVVSFKEIGKLLTTEERLLSMAVDRFFDGYSKSSGLISRIVSGLISTVIKPLLLKTVQDFFEVVTQKSGKGRELEKSRKIYGEMIFDIVDNFFSESQHMSFYRECLTDLMNKVHGEDIDREILKEKYLRCLKCVAEDIQVNKTLMKGIRVGITRVSHILDEEGK